MAELLNLNNFDEKNLKACCPYHNENTPSFVYDKKRARFHCFSCQKTVDIVDVLQETGKTFLDSVKYLFDKAEIDFSFGEQGIKTRRNYKYPHEEPMNDKTHVYEYWGKRGISKETIDYLDIREDMQGNTVFNYYDLNDVLTMCKYRPSRTIDKSKKEIKNWCQKDADTFPLLFNMNRINTTQPLIIVEGEGDCMSVIEAGYTNCVSIPFGAGNLHFLEENWDWLSSFDTIIIWSDNDNVGIKMRKECVARLGTWRTKYIDMPEYVTKTNGKEVKVKDANDTLQVLGKKGVLDIISNACDCPVKSVVDYADIEELDISEMEGVETGIKPIDDALLKIFRGTLTILSGRPSSGKTSIVDQIIANTMDKGSPVFLYSKEMPERISTNWFNMIIAGRRNMVKKTARDNRDYYVVSQEAKTEIRQYYKGKLKFYRDDEPNDEESILKSMEECIRKYGCKLLVLDNLMTIDLKCNDENMNSSQTDLINKLINIAGKFNVAIILIAHPKKMQDKNSDVSMYDICGTSNIINLAMRTIGMRRTSKEEKEDKRSKWYGYDVVFTIVKDRLLPGRNDMQIGLYFDSVSRRFFTNEKELDYKFAWDMKDYTTQIQMSDVGVAQRDRFPDR